MRTGLLAFRIFTVVAWLTMVWISYVAIRDLGTAVAIPLFVSDYENPWRAQFNSDFVVHLLLAMSWFLWRFKSLTKGLVCAILVWFTGSVFLLAYIFITLLRNGGDVKALLLGDRATPA